MITAASTVFGRYEIGSVKSRMRRIEPAATRPASCVRTPSESFTAARGACADGKALAAGRGVGRSHREHLLFHPHVLAMLAGERPRGEDLVGETDEEDSDRRRQEQEHNRESEVEVGMPLGTLSATATPRSSRSSTRSPDRADDDEQRCGKAAGDVA